MPEVHKLARVEGHVGAEQGWKVKALQGKQVYIQLAGTRKDGSTNRFAYKHILSPSKKDGVTTDVKLHRRLFHRFDKGGVAADNPSPGGKAQSPYSMSRGDKYANALGNTPDAKNTAIDLTVLNLDTVLVQMAEALLKAAWQDKEAHLDVQFSKACVKTADRAGNVTAASKISIQAYKVSEASFEVYHCGGAA